MPQKHGGSKGLLKKREREGATLLPRTLQKERERERERARERARAGVCVCVCVCESVRRKDPFRAGNDPVPLYAPSDEPTRTFGG